MEHKSDNLSDREKLEAENDFLKMKIMLERGGEVHRVNSEESLPPEVENEFLNSIIEFEKQFDERKTIKVFERIGRPGHFRAVSEIPDSEIEEAYNALLDYLEQYGIGFGVCSPNISTRELYRFVTEELFQQEIDDIRLPGWMTNFVYDEFYPDPVYDCSTDAESCMNYILRKEPLDFMYHCRNKNLQLNNHKSLAEDECLEIVNRFKLAYEELAINEINVFECSVNEKESFVKGSYNVNASTTREIQSLSGNWELVFEKDEEWGYWFIHNIQIHGINF